MQSADFPVILGIDPGSRIVGFAVLRGKIARPRMPRDFEVVDAGVIKAKAELSVPERLGLIHEAVHGLAGELAPTHCAIEKAFHGINAASAIKLGEARGAILAAVRRHGLSIFEITPAEVKRTIACKGSASKEDVCRAVTALLGFDRGKLPFDATDAVAIALACGLNIAFTPAGVKP
jgi:crossover junction endodeoxyribonuclease RuvC